MKKLLLLVSILALGLTLSACDKDPEPIDEPVGLESVTLAGYVDQGYYVGAVVDVLDGVTAVGSDGVDYSDQITVDSDECDITEGMLDTSGPNTCTVVYTVVVEGKLDRESITILLENEPLPPNEGPILAEWNFDTADDLVGWTKYENGAGTVTESVEDGALKLVTTSGGMVYETRFEYMGLPLELGVAYEITFMAKSDVDGKMVHLQFGELISYDPWFVDFKPGQVDDITLTTEWAEYSFEFVMTIDNQNGGPLFEMGDMAGSTGIDATIWLDDIVIKGGTGEDNIKPVINGVEDTTIYLGDATTFDPMAGVTASDFPDVDLTDDVIISGDTVDPTVAGTYNLYYVVFDAAMNSVRYARTITVEADTEAPMVDGLDAVVIQVGDTFDLLEGVTASDNRDGDVTADIVLGGDVFDANVAAVYDVTYTITDENLNSETYHRLITVSAMIWNSTDLMPNGTFDLNPWYVWSQDWGDVPTVTNEMVAGELVVDTDLLGEANWAIQLVQEGMVLVEGNQYQITFDAYAETARDINFKLIDGNGAEFLYVASLTDTVQTFTYSFTYDGTSTSGKLDFELGLIGAAVAGFINFDNVKFEDFDGTAVVADTDQVVNGDMALTNLTGWGSWSADWFDPAITSTMTEEWNELVFRYEGGAGDASWNHQLGFEGITFEYGVTYQLTFDAKSDLARDFQVNIWDGQMGHESGALALLEDEFATYTHVFTYLGDADAKVEFQLGKLTDNVDGTVFYLDNVVLEVLEQAPTVLNGDFEATGWSVWSQDWDEGTGVPAVTGNIVDGEFVVDTDLLGDYNWSIQLFQEGIVLVEGNQYQVSFDAYAETARDINFKLIDGNSAEFLYVASLTDTVQTFTYSFTYDGTSTEGKLDFELGVIGSAVAGFVNFDNVKFEDFDGTAVVADTNQVVNGDLEQPLEFGAWFGDEWSGVTTSSVAVNNGVLEIVVAGLTDTHAAYATQVFQEGMEFRQGVTYTIQFDAYADVARQINVNLGEPFDGAPYFVNFTPTEVFDLTDAVQTFSFTFTMDAVTNENGKLVFELGTIDGAFINTTVYIDNIQIFENYNPQG